MKSATTIALLAAALPLASAPASAIDYSLSGFGTIGYARSDQSYAYQRFIDDSGTFKRDSVFGGQVDAQFSPQWRATVQAKVAPAEDNDARWQPTISWAFVSWRPSNDWLFRVGKLRVPLYLTSENLDVGATFDPVRMPAEMYSISPSNDFTGASFNKSWSLDNGDDLSLDGFWGKSKLHWRFFLRDGVPGFLPGSPPLQAAGPLFVGIKTEALGLAATYRKDDHLFRIGANQTYTEREDGAAFPLTFPTFSYLGNTLYKVDSRLPLGPALDSKGKFAAQVYTLGVDLNLGHDYRLIGEYARRVVNEIKIGPDTEGAYATLLKRLGAWTPYVSYARLLSKPGSRQLYQGLNGVKLAPSLPLATLINASQRAAADGVPAYDQYSLALGASYALSPTSKLKGEWMRVHIGEMSSFIDQPAGSSGVSRQAFNVLSLSYSFVF